MISAARPRIAFVIAFLATILIATPASAYINPSATNVTVTGPQGQVTCGQGYDFAATVFDANGLKVTGATVQWSEVGAPAGATDTIAPTSSVTDATGVAHTTVTFGGPDGARTIRASALGSSGQVVVGVSGCVTPPKVHWNIGDCQSALGLTPTDSYSHSTKVQTLGHYI